MPVLSSNPFSLFINSFSLSYLYVLMNLADVFMSSSLSFPHCLMSYDDVDGSYFSYQEPSTDSRRIILTVNLIGQNQDVFLLLLPSDSSLSSFSDLVCPCCVWLIVG